MLRAKNWEKRPSIGRARLAGLAAIFLTPAVVSGPGFAEAPFEFSHPAADRVYDRLPIPLRISRRPGTKVAETEAINVHFEIREWPHPYGFVSEMWNSIPAGKTGYETRMSYFWTIRPGTYSIRARADGFEDHPVEVTFSTTFSLERPLYRIAEPAGRVHRGGKLALIVDWDPFWETVPQRPYGTLYAEVESWDEDEQAWQPELKSGNLAGFELPVVLPKQVSVDLSAPEKPLAKRVRARASFSRKAYTLPSQWHYFCHVPAGKASAGSAETTGDLNDFRNCLEGLRKSGVSLPE